MNTTKVITIAGIMVVLLVVWPQTADAGTSFSIGVRIGGCHTPTLHRSIGPHDCCRLYRHSRKHYGGYYRIGANYHRISLPVIAHKRTGGRFGSSLKKHNRNRGRTSHVRGRH